MIFGCLADWFLSTIGCHCVGTFGTKGCCCMLLGWVICMDWLHSSLFSFSFTLLALILSNQNPPLSVSVVLKMLRMPKSRAVLSALLFQWKKSGEKDLLQPTINFFMWALKYFWKMKYGPLSFYLRNILDLLLGLHPPGATVNPILEFFLSEDTLIQDKSLGSMSRTSWSPLIITGSNI